MNRKQCYSIVLFLTVAATGHGAESGSFTLETVRELVARNEALLNPIKMAYTVKKSRTGERQVYVGGKRSRGRRYSHLNCIWAQAGEKHYAREDYFYGPNELARSVEKVFEPQIVTEGKLPDLMEGTIRPRDDHDWYSVLVAKLGLRPFEGHYTLSRILVPEHASVHDGFETVNDHQTYVVDARRSVIPRYFARIWIDRQRGMPLRIWYFGRHPNWGDEKSTSQINDIKLHQLPNGGWMPIEGIRSLEFSDDEISYEHITVDVNSVTIRSEDIPESMFKIAFPDGARIYNAISGLTSVKDRPFKTYEKIIETGHTYIAGTVVDENGAPVPRVVVGPHAVRTRQSNGRVRARFFNGHDRPCAITDAKGCFAIELEEEGSYELWVFPEDFVDMRVGNVPLGKHDLKISLRKGGTVTGRVVQIIKGKKVPVPGVKVTSKEGDRTSFTSIRFGRMRARTDSEGRFEIRYLDTLMPRHKTGDLGQPQHVPRIWQIGYGSASESVLFKDGKGTQDVELVLKPNLRQVLPLIGRTWPDLEGIKINLAADQIKDKIVLICFFDMQQRPSRYCIRELVKRAEELREKGVTVVAIQASRVDEDKLNEWVKNYNIPFPVGMIQGDEEKIRFTWGVRSLPWLILTDSEHIVHAEGFGLNELGQKLNETADITSGKTQVGPTQESSVSASTSTHSPKEPEKSLQSEKSRLVTSEPSNRQIRVVGVARDQNGKPIAGVEVQRLHGSGPVRTDPRGEFELVWDPKRNRPLVDTYYIIARHERENLSIVVEVPEFEQDTKTVNLNLLLGMIFSGKVVDPAGKGIELADVRILLHTPTQGSGLFKTTTDSEGIFEFRGIPTGHEYSFFAKASGFGTTWMHGIYAGHDFARKDFKLEPITLAIADQSVSGLVVDANDKPVPGARLWTDGKGQPNYNLRTDVEGKFTIDGVCTGNLRIFATIRGENRPSGHAITQGGATNVRIVVAEKPSPEGRLFVPKSPPSLVGRALPELKDLGIELSSSEGGSRGLLLCFFDMEQRPSRNCLRQLSTRAQELKVKDVVVMAVQASKIDEIALNEWIKKYNIPFPAGMIEGDEEKIRFNWGVRSLPWLILTDKKHIVRTEGFALSEFDAKIKEVAP